MKKILTFALLAVLLAACKKDPENTGPGTNPTKPGDITFKATFAENTLPGGFDLFEIGYAVAANDPVSIVFNGASAASSYKVGTVGEDDVTLTGSLKWPEFSTEYGFRAYVNGGTYSAPNVSVPSPVFSGDGTSHLKNGFLLVATPTKATSPAKDAANPAVALEFHNLMSVIEVAIAAEDAGLTISKIEIEATNDIFPTDGKVDVSAEGAEFGKITATTKVKVTSLAISGNPSIPQADNAETPTNAKKFYIPTAAVGESGEIKIKITTSDGPQTFTVESIDFALGKLFKIPVLLEGEDEPLPVWDGWTRTEPSKDPNDADGKTYLIENGEHLAWISKAYTESTKTTPAEGFSGLPKFLEGLTFVLTNNIDLGNHDWGGTATNPDPEATEDLTRSFMIGGTNPNTNAFWGTIDGDGYTIRNYYLKVTGVTMGFVRINGGTIKNLTIRGKIDGEPEAGATNIGGIASRNDSCLDDKDEFNKTWRANIINCHSYLDIELTNVDVIGGIVSSSGRNGGVGYIKGCTFNGTITANGGDVKKGGRVGGIAGDIAAPLAEDITRVHGIAQCVNNGVITADTESVATDGVGGVVGSNNGKYNALIQQCINTANITGKNNVGGIVGRVGYKGVNVMASYNTGNISGSKNVGGVVGFVEAAAKTPFDAPVITACYNIGKVTGTSSGGVVGYNWGTIKTSFWGGTEPHAVGSNDEPANTTTTFPGATSTTNLFTQSAWPDATMEGWKLVGDDGYWASHGSFSLTAPVYPSLP